MSKKTKKVFHLVFPFAYNKQKKSYIQIKTTKGIFVSFSLASVSILYALAVSAFLSVPFACFLFHLPAFSLIVC